MKLEYIRAGELLSMQILPDGIVLANAGFDEWYGTIWNAEYTSIGIYVGGQVILARPFYFNGERACRMGFGDLLCDFDKIAFLPFKGDETLEEKWEQKLAEQHPMKHEEWVQCYLAGNGQFKTGFNLMAEILNQSLTGPFDLPDFGELVSGKITLKKGQQFTQEKQYGMPCAIMPTWVKKKILQLQYKNFANAQQTSDLQNIANQLTEFVNLAKNPTGPIFFDIHQLIENFNTLNVQKIEQLPEIPLEIYTKNPVSSDAKTAIAFNSHLNQMSLQDLKSMLIQADESKQIDALTSDMLKATITKELISRGIQYPFTSN